MVEAKKETWKEFQSVRDEEISNLICILFTKLERSDLKLQKANYRKVKRILSGIAKWKSEKREY